MSSVTKTLEHDKSFSSSVKFLRKWKDYYDLNELDFRGLLTFGIFFFFNALSLSLSLSIYICDNHRVTLSRHCVMTITQRSLFTMTSDPIHL
jgi:hypothetical protein